MKKFFRVLMYVLALNFLTVGGGVGYLWRTGHLDRGRALAIKDVLFPPTAPSKEEAALGGAPGATTQPSVQLEDLLKKAAGMPAEDQVEFLQRSFDSRIAQQDLRQRELTDQQRQLDFGQRRLADDRAALEAEKKQLAAVEQKAALDASDQGFQDSLALYSAMPSKQVKTIFLTLNEATVQRYLEAMPPRTAAKIIKEFKTPTETDRIQKVLERMRRQNQPDSPPPPSSASANGP